MYHYFWADDPWVMGQKLKLFKITSKHGNMCFGPVDTVEGVCNGFLALYTFSWFPEFSGYHQWQQESQ